MIDALEISGIDAFYGDSHVLNGVSFALKQGRLLGLLGRNGAGKTTCMSTIMGFVRPRKGSISLFGEAVAGLAPESQVRLEAALDHVGLPVRMPPVPLKRLQEAILQDKKRASGAVRWILTPQIGGASVPRAVDSRLVRNALVHAGARPTRA